MPCICIYCRFRHLAIYQVLIERKKKKKGLKNREKESHKENKSTKVYTEQIMSLNAKEMLGLNAVSQCYFFTYLVEVWELFVMQYDHHTFKFPALMDCVLI